MRYFKHILYNAFPLTIFFFLSKGPAHSKHKKIHTLEIKKILLLIRDVKIVTFRGNKLPMAEEESPEFEIFIRKKVLRFLGDFIPEENFNFAKGSRISRF